MYSYILKGYRVPDNFNLSKEELAHEMTIHVIHLLSRFNSDKSSLKSYIKMVAKHYLFKQFNNINALKRAGEVINHIQDGEDEIDLYDSYSFQKAMESNIMLASDNHNFVRDCLFWWILNVDKYFRKGSKQHKAASRIIEILITKESFEGKFGQFVRLKLGISRQVFQIIMVVMRQVNKRLYIQWLEKGVLDE
jgi:hypothetical protein